MRGVEQPFAVGGRQSLQLLSQEGERLLQGEKRRGGSRSSDTPVSRKRVSVSDVRETSSFVCVCVLSGCNLTLIKSVNYLEEGSGGTLSGKLFLRGPDQ